MNEFGPGPFIAIGVIIGIILAIMVVLLYMARHQPDQRGIVILSGPFVFLSLFLGVSWVVDAVGLYVFPGAWLGLIATLIWALTLFSYLLLLLILVIRGERD